MSADQESESWIPRRQLSDVTRLYEWRNAYGQTFMTDAPPDEDDDCASEVREWVPSKQEGQQ